MIREINKKKYLLQLRKPYASSIEKYLRELWLSEWIFSSNKLNGSNMNLNETMKILKGDCILERTIEDHMDIKCHEEVIQYIEKMVDNGDALFAKEIEVINTLLSSDDMPVYRNNNPVLQNIKYVPVHFKEVPNKMEKLFKWYYSEAQEMNPVLRGVLLHNKLIEIYPFAQNTEKTARALINYELLKGGLPPVEFKMQPKTYVNMIKDYVSKQDTTDFYELILGAVDARMDLFLRLTSGN